MFKKKLSSMQESAVVLFRRGGSLAAASGCSYPSVDSAPNRISAEASNVATACSIDTWNAIGIIACGAAVLVGASKARRLPARCSLLDFFLMCSFAAHKRVAPYGNRDPCDAS